MGNSGAEVTFRAVPKRDNRPWAQFSLIDKYFLGLDRRVRRHSSAEGCPRKSPLRAVSHGHLSSWANLRFTLEGSMSGQCLSISTNISVLYVRKRKGPLWFQLCWPLLTNISYQNTHFIIGHVNFPLLPTLTGCGLSFLCAFEQLCFPSEIFSFLL